GFNASTGTCTSATGGTIPVGEFAPISYNQLFGSCFLYYPGPEIIGVNPPSALCGGGPCSPPHTSPFRALLVRGMETLNAIAIQSPHLAFSLLGNDIGGALSFSFGTTTASDYCALPRTLVTDFAVPGAPLFAGPSNFPPGINFDTASAIELQTNIILLNL